jgi:hypothetical protein
MKLVEKYRIDKKISKLEKLYLERTMGRGNEPSKAYVIWKHLIDNGDKTVDQLKSELPKDITKYINFFADNGLLNKNGNTISANQDYAWDDVGVIPRTAQQELMNSIRNMSDADDIVDDADAEAPAAETPARAPRARRVKANIFSKKPEEVKAALDEGTAVDARDDKGRTPIEVACCARKGDTGAVIKLLLDNGANPNEKCPVRPAVVCTVMYGNKEGTIALSNAGANLVVPGKDKRTLMMSIIDSGLFTSAEVMGMITEQYFRNWITNNNTYTSISDIIYEGCLKLGNERNFTNHVVDMLFKATTPDVACSKLNTHMDSKSTWLLVADAVARNGYTMKFISSSYYANKIARDKQMADKIYDQAEQVAQGNLKPSDLSALVKAVMAICSVQHKPLDILGNILTQSTFDELTAEDQWNTLISAIYAEKDFGESSCVALSKGLTKLKFKSPTSKDIGGVLHTYCTGDRNIIHNNDLRRLVCRKIRPYIKTIDEYDIRNNIAYSKDPLFINNMIDAGLGEALAAVTYGMSDVCRSELRSAGLISDSGERPRESDDAHLIRRIIRHISDDTMSTEVRRKINEDPSILANDSIQSALDDPSNADSVTARQLKRQYDQWYATTDKPKYDL